MAYQPFNPYARTPQQLRDSVQRGDYALQGQDKSEYSQMQRGFDISTQAGNRFMEKDKPSFDARDREQMAQAAPLSTLNIPKTELKPYVYTPSQLRKTIQYAENIYQKGKGIYESVVPEVAKPLIEGAAYPWRKLGEKVGVELSPASVVSAELGTIEGLTSFGVVPTSGETRATIQAVLDDIESGDITTANDNLTTAQGGRMVGNLIGQIAPFVAVDALTGGTATAVIAPRFATQYPRIARMIETVVGNASLSIPQEIQLAKESNDSVKTVARNVLLGVIFDAILPGGTTDDVISRANSFMKNKSEYLKSHGVETIGEFIQKNAKQPGFQRIPFMGDEEADIERAIRESGLDLSETDKLVDEADGLTGIDRMSSGTTFTLPNTLRRSSPRYTTNTVEFASDLDKSLYIVGGSGKSKSHDQFLAELKKAFPEKTDEEIISAGKIVRDKLKEAAKGKAYDNIYLPEIINWRVVETPTKVMPVRQPKVKKVQTPQELKKEIQDGIAANNNLNELESMTAIWREELGQRKSKIARVVKGKAGETGKAPITEAVQPLADEATVLNTKAYTQKFRELPDEQIDIMLKSQDNLTRVPAETVKLERLSEAGDTAAIRELYSKHSTGLREAGQSLEASKEVLEIPEVKAAKQIDEYTRATGKAVTDEEVVVLAEQLKEIKRIENEILALENKLPKTAKEQQIVLRRKIKSYKDRLTKTKIKTQKLSAQREVLDFIRLRTRGQKVNYETGDIEQVGKDVLKGKQPQKYAGNKEREAALSVAQKTQSAALDSFKTLGQKADTYNMGEVFDETVTNGTIEYLAASKKAQKKLDSVFAGTKKADRKLAYEALLQDNGFIYDGITKNDLKTQAQRDLYERMDWFLKSEEGVMRGLPLQKSIEAETRKKAFLPVREKEYVKGVKRSREMPGWVKLEKEPLSKNQLKLDPRDLFKEDTESTMLGVHYMSGVKKWKDILETEGVEEILGTRVYNDLLGSTNKVLEKYKSGGLEKFASQMLGQVRAVKLFLNLGTSAMQVMNNVYLFARHPKAFMKGVFSGKVAKEGLLTGLKDPVIDFTDPGVAVIRAFNEVGSFATKAIDTGTRIQAYRTHYQLALKDLKQLGYTGDELYKKARLQAFRKTQDFMGGSMPHEIPEELKSIFMKEASGYLRPTMAMYRSITTEIENAFNKKGFGAGAGAIASALGAAVTMNMTESLVRGYTPNELLIAMGLEDEEKDGQAAWLRKELGLDILAAIPGAEIAVRLATNDLPGLTSLKDLVDVLASDASAKKKLKESFFTLFSGLKKYKDAINAYQKQEVSYSGESVPVSTSQAFQLPISSKWGLEQGRRTLMDLQGYGEPMEVKKTVDKLDIDGDTLLQDITKLSTIHKRTDLEKEVVRRIKEEYDVPTNPEAEGLNMIEAIQKMPRTTVENLYYLSATPAGGKSKFQTTLEKFVKNMQGEKAVEELKKKAHEYTKLKYSEKLEQEKLEAGSSSVQEQHQKRLQKIQALPLEERAAAMNKLKEDFPASEYKPKEYKRGISQSDTGVLEEKTNYPTTKKIILPFGQNKGRTECGEFFNDVMGYKPGDPMRVGDTIQSKEKDPTFKLIKDGGEPVFGGFFTKNYKDTGHIGFVTGVRDDGIYVIDSNANGKGEKDERFIAKDSSEYKQIRGFGGEKYGLLNAILKQKEKAVGRKLSKEEKENLWNSLVSL